VSAPVPSRDDRRRFLQAGLLSAAGVLLGACSGDDEGQRPLRPSTTTTSAPPGPSRGAELDVVLVNTAVSLEVLAVEAYGTALDSGLVASATFAEAMRLCQAHHAEHRARLAELVLAAGGQPYETANAVVKVGFVDPRLAGAGNEVDLARVLYDLEQTMSLSYVHAATELSIAELRQIAVSIASIDARHATVLERLGELRNDKPAFAPTEDPLPSDARLPG